MAAPRGRKDGQRMRSTSLHVPVELDNGRRQNAVIVEAITAYLDAADS